MDKTVALGKAIHMMRTRREMTRQELVDRAQATDPGAGEAGLSASSLNRLEKGQRSPRFSELMAICEATGVSLGELVDLFESFIREPSDRLFPERLTGGDDTRPAARVRRLLADLEVELGEDASKVHVHVYLPADWKRED